jgi:signal transduction histidine kinase
MLTEFVERHREEILSRTRSKVAVRMAPRPTESELEHGVPLFVDQLIETLRAHAERGTASDPALGQTAANHGATRLRLGFTVDQLVHDYGDVCQAITELAVDLDRGIPADDFRTLNKCLDFAIARAVTEFEHQRERHMLERENERSGFLAHELRNLLTTAKLSFHILKQGKVGVGGSTGAVLERTLNALSQMIDRSIATVRAASGIIPRDEVQIAELMEQLQVVATIEASNHGHKLEVQAVDPELVVMTDRLMVEAAVTNLIRNAFKFSRPGGSIALRALRTDASSVRIEVEDECGGLPAGQPEGLFERFRQQSPDRSGLGLGLAISRESVRAAGGELTVLDLPGKGCVFSVELPLTSRTPLPTMKGLHPVSER